MRCWTDGQMTPSSTHNPLLSELGSVAVRCDMITGHCMYLTATSSLNALQATV